MNTTVTIQIGNSDDALSQKRWNNFFQRMHASILIHAEQIHFSGGPPTVTEWQNYCWVIEISPVVVPELLSEIRHIRAEFNQQSVAVTKGETLFV